MKFKYIVIAAVLFFVAAFWVIVRDIKQAEHFSVAKREIGLRKIGHEILLQSGDSISRVLPVEKIADHEYQLRFEKQFGFQPDSLVRIVRRSLAATNEYSDYIVNVTECSANAVVYGYSVANQKQNDIIPCSGRKQPSGCYTVVIQFRNSSSSIKKYSAAGLLLAIVIFFPVIIVGYRRKRANPIATPGNSNTSVYIGSILFDTKSKCLNTASERVALTAKESKLLTIFAHSPNQVIDRLRLQKEIWEDDGIIVGRSLDVFISRLRKKLEIDASVQLINIHGRGYKLEIGKPL